MAQAGRSGPRLGADLFGVKRMEAFMHRVGVRRSDGESFESKPAPPGPRYVSDTGELTWDTEKRSVMVDAKRSKAIIGDGRGRTANLGGLEVKVDSDWACLQATVIEGEDFATARRLLITATASTENTSMQWKDAAKTSVVRNWGKAPCLVEGVRATVRLTSKQSWKAWALDERGARRDSVPMQENTIHLGPEHQTLWYEVAVQ